MIVVGPIWRGGAEHLRVRGGASPAYSVVPKSQELLAPRIGFEQEESKESIQGGIEGQGIHT